ncbi:MAG: GNAT family N-acetyltransferase [Coriobacteriia bacterium]|nr:GNAT family N-acetyltransferase [Coriobacteriia bacterium]
MPISVRRVKAGDRAWVRDFGTERWGSDLVAYSYACYVPSELDGLVAELDGEPSGLLTFVREDSTLHIVSLDARVRSVGVGTALLDAAARLATDEGRRFLRVTTTNDDLDSLRFYQRRGFRLVDLMCGGADAARLLKPQIPRVGEHGIPRRDEVVLEREVWPAEVA